MGETIVPAKGWVLVRPLNASATPFGQAVRCDRLTGTVDGRYVRDPKSNAESPVAQPATVFVVPLAGHAVGDGLRLVPFAAVIGWVAV